MAALANNRFDPSQMNGYDRALIESVAGNYRLTPATLYSRIEPSWIPKDFLTKAALIIAKAVAKGNQLITVSAPPRHGKSRLTTIATPIWCMEVLKKFHVILCTYGGDLSTDFGREVKDIVERSRDALTFDLRKDVQRNAHWLTKQGGGMTSVGVGGPITGRGANVLLIDDYIKEIEEAESPNQREKDWRWLTTVALTRLEPNATCIITATRWHPDDIIGRIKRGLAGPGWIHIEFPAEYLPMMERLNADGSSSGEMVPDHEAVDMLGRRYGDVLFEERYPEESLKLRRHFLGDRMYDALFQQNPHDDSTVQTDRKWINLEVQALTNWYGYEFVRVWDFAGTKGGGDWTVGMLLAVHPLNGDTWILDIQRGQWSVADIETRVKDNAISDGIGVPIIIEQEPGSAGKNLVEHFDNILPGYQVLASPTTTSKGIRARPFITAAERGRVHILNRKWSEDYLEEFDGFLSRAKNDDQMDCCAIGYNHLFKMPDGGVVFGRDVVHAQNQMLAAKIARLTDRQDGSAPYTLEEIIREVTKDQTSPNQGALTWGRDTSSGLYRPNTPGTHRIYS